MAQGEAIAQMASKSLPTPPRPKVLAISKLRKCPVQVNLHTEQLIEAIRSSLEEGRAAPGITVGLVGGVHYIVDGHARVEACDRAEFVEINVGEVLELGSMADLLVEHVRRNIRSPLNPVKVLGVAALLAKQGVERPLTVLHLTPVMEAAVRVLSMWPGELVGMVSDLIDRKSGRFSDVYAVPHFFTAFQDLSFRVDRREKGAQEELKGIVTYIVRYLDSIGDEREFAFPGPDQILALMRDRRKQIKMAAQVAKSSARASSTSERATRKQQARRRDGDGGGEEDDAEADDEIGYEEPLMMPDRNKSMIKCTQCGSPQVIDLKTGHVCPVETVAGGMIDVIRDGDGHRSYALSMKAMKFLGLDRPFEEVSPANYNVISTDKKSEVERAIRSARPTSRFVLIISDGQLHVDNDANKRGRDSS